MPFKENARKFIGEILIEEGYLEQGTLEEALKIQKEKGGLIGEILVRMGVISEEQLVVALSKQLSIPFIRLPHYNVNREALGFIPRETAERHLLFPFERDEEELSVALGEPLNPEIFSQLEEKISLRVQRFLAPLSDIRQAIEVYYKG